MNETLFLASNHLSDQIHLRERFSNSIMWLFREEMFIIQIFNYHVTTDCLVDPVFLFLFWSVLFQLYACLAEVIERSRNVTVNFSVIFSVFVVKSISSENIFLVNRKRLNNICYIYVIRNILFSLNLHFYLTWHSCWFIPLLSAEHYQ